MAAHSTIATLFKEHLDNTQLKLWLVQLGSSSRPSLFNNLSCVCTDTNLHKIHWILALLFDMNECPFLLWLEHRHITYSSSYLGLNNRAIVCKPRHVARARCPSLWARRTNTDTQGENTISFILACRCFFRMFDLGMSTKGSKISLGRLTWDESIANLWGQVFAKFPHLGKAMTSATQIILMIVIV